MTGPGSKKTMSKSNEPKLTRHNLGRVSKFNYINVRRKKAMGCGMPMKNRVASGNHRGLIRGTQRSTQVWAPTPDSGDSGLIGPDIYMLSNFVLNFNFLAMPHDMWDLVS